MADDATRIRQFNIRRFWLVAAAAIGVVAIGLGIFFFSGVYSEWVYTERLAELQTDNNRLVQQIRQHELMIQALQQQLDSIIEQDNRLRELVKLPKIEDDVRKVGVGGEVHRDEANLEYLLPVKDIDLPGITATMEYLQRLVKLEFLSYSELLTTVEADVERFCCYPAIRPVKPESCRLSSDFGQRRDPITHRYQHHTGHDWSARTGTPVKATADGIVRSSKYYGTFGNYIEIDHGFGYTTIYGHLSKRKVKRGDRVLRGQIIGSVGNTGKSTASHLHYEIQYRQKCVDPIAYYFDVPLN